jgi:hypothetical protein
MRKQSCKGFREIRVRNLMHLSLIAPVRIIASESICRSRIGACSSGLEAYETVVIGPRFGSRHASETQARHKVKLSVLSISLTSNHEVFGQEALISESRAW